jgi:hypothetical protein
VLTRTGDARVARPSRAGDNQELRGKLNGILEVEDEKAAGPEDEQPADGTSIGTIISLDDDSPTAARSSGRRSLTVGVELIGGVHAEA